MCTKVTLNEITSKVCAAAKETLGEKLEKVLLFGSYARGDYDEESDIDIFVLADIQQEDVDEVRDEIHAHTGDLGLEYDIVVSLHMAGSDNFYSWRNVLPFYMNVQKDGVELYA